MLNWWVATWCDQASTITKKGWQHYTLTQGCSGPLGIASVLPHDSSSEDFSTPYGLLLQIPHTLPNETSIWGRPLNRPHTSMASLCPLCTHWIHAGPQRPPRGHWRLQVCGLQLSKGMCWLSTLNYNLTWRENKNIVMCIFFPEMIIIVLQTSTTKMEKLLQKIIY